MQWMRLVTYKTEKKIPGGNHKAGKALAAFLAAMIFCTILSRAASNMITPTVKVASPRKGTISHKIFAAGTTVENQNQAVFTVSDIRIKLVPVKKGESVQKGDTLFVLDLEDLRDKIEEKEREVQKAELQMKDMDSQESLQQEKKTQAQQRAQEDYDRTVRSTDAQVEEAYQAKLDAEERLREFMEQSTGETSEDMDTIQKVLQQTCDDKSRLLEEAQARLDEVQGNPDATDAEKQSLEQEAAQAKADKEAADAALEQFTAKQESAQSESNKEQIQSLQDASKQADQAYQEALRNQEESLAAADRNREDAGTPSASDSSRKIMELDKKTLEKKLDKMKALLKQKGVLTAPVSGVIQKLNVEPGSFTTEALAVSIADSSAGSRFVAQIPKEQKMYAAAGDEVTLKTVDKRELTGLTVDTITENRENSELYDISVLLKKGELGIGESAILNLEKESSAYGCTIPTEALRTDENGWFVLVVREKETVLGTELSAEPVYVQIQEKNEQTAALEDGILGGGDRVIISSDKPIETGDRIRQGEES
ncbi:hypothetical protein HGO97_005780 [Faecalicatena sp. AGMB00832]|uniref:Biotin/lipoyl-binding protein n=1 Tax=Faecalicatena faecalis TaxID=2726362 RepID=A0ABS6D156_9FIRM|nr:hypothetical protein [Faecalicatena faecalis]MBU3875327.1 hypothetical protein [Faecalicatena faecalis]